ncbi:unnamed protein product [Adineta ricciae]|uniref:RING-type domain-containing protein n=1 Tax=Adineta ricciae TaxID=249248 RepID=A0A814QEY3_ADIRI|nr:unnamed protein product [Adineta ricciae]
MPINLRHSFNRIPLPSLPYYTLISSTLLVGHVFYLHQSIQSNVSNSLADTNITNHSILNANQTIVATDSKPFSWNYIRTFMTTLFSQSLSLLIFVNAIYCFTALLARQLQRFVFGELRSFCFLFGVLGLENLHELIIWISWFFILAFAFLFCQLIKDRFELFSTSITVSRQSLNRILCLLICLLCLCSGLFSLCYLVGFKHGGLSIFLFMLAETLLLTLDTSYLILKYALLQQRTNEYRSHILYYLEFSFDISALVIDICYHLQMLFYHHTFMSMSSLIFFMQLKPLFNELTQRLKRHRSYRLAMTRMEKKYPLLTKHDLEEKARKQNCLSSSEEICAICWEQFDKARCLPCGHLFHQNCLRSWLEQDASCPICRLSLQEDTNAVASRTGSINHDLPITTDQRRGRNHLFRFDGHRYSSWLPSFSIMINHNFPFRFGRARLTGVQLTIILANLQQTQSMDATIDNIVEQRIQFEPQQEQEDDDEESEDENEPTSELDVSSGIPFETTESTYRNLLLNSLETTEDNADNFVWPLDPSLPFEHRKQLLISHMRRQYLERDRRLQLSSNKCDQ